jgi:hypothetical protein
VHLRLLSSPGATLLVRKQDVNPISLSDENARSAAHECFAHCEIAELTIEWATERFCGSASVRDRVATRGLAGPAAVEAGSRSLWVHPEIARRHYQRSRRSTALASETVAPGLVRSVSLLLEAAANAS